VIALPVGGSFRTGDDCQPGRHRAGSQACAVDRTADLGNALPCRRPAHRNASRGRNARRPSARRIGICKLAHHRRPDAHAGRWYWPHPHGPGHWLPLSGGASARAMPWLLR